MQAKTHWGKIHIDDDQEPINNMFVFSITKTNLKSNLRADRKSYCEITWFKPVIFACGKPKYQTAEGVSYTISIGCWNLHPHIKKVRVIFILFYFIIYLHNIITIIYKCAWFFGVRSVLVNHSIFHCALTQYVLNTPISTHIKSVSRAVTRINMRICQLHNLI